MTRMKLPLLLTRRMKEAGLLHPLALSITERLNGISVADLTLPPEDAVPEMGGWVKLFSLDGVPALYRITRMEQTAGGSTRLALEHGLSTLADAVMPGAYVLDGSITCGTAVQALMAAQHGSRWTFDAAGSYAAFCRCTVRLSLRHADLWTILSALLAEAGEDYILRCDMTTSPWTMRVVRASETVSAELRLSRNASRVRWCFDMADLCTRLYAIGGTGQNTFTVAEVNGGSPWIAAETSSTWGIHDAVYTDAIADTPALLLSRASRVLEGRMSPPLRIEADAADLSELTDEPLDALTLGKRCRVTIPGRGITLKERITAVTLPDAVREPWRVQLTLGGGAACTMTNQAG